MLSMQFQVLIQVTALGIAESSPHGGGISTKAPWCVRALHQILINTISVLFVFR